MQTGKNFMHEIDDIGNELSSDVSREVIFDIKTNGMQLNSIENEEDRVNQDNEKKRQKKMQGKNKKRGQNKK